VSELQDPAFDFTHNRAPIYVQLSTLFRRFIVSGQWRVEGRIPTHEDLAAQFEVNPATVRKAIAMLEDEGLVRRYRRHGTFVVAKPASAEWCRIGTTWSEALKAYDGLAQTVLEAKDVAVVSEPFHEPGTPAAGGYRFMRRLYRRGRDPLVVEDSYLDQRLRRKIGDAKLESAPVLVLLDALAGFAIERADETIRFGIADAEIGGMLNVPLNAAVAIIYQSVYGPHAALYYESRAYLRGDVARVSEAIKFEAAA
jgi:GntR family transcriptional regulator